MHTHIAAQHHVAALDSTMAYREVGASGRAVALFLHGNPTSSFIWRNIMPQVAPVARCIAPDLIGFGQSGKPDIEYRFFDHVRYLDAFIEALHIDRFFLVAQDWGTALAFHLAARQPEQVCGLAFMEFIRPMPSWADFHQSPAARETFRKFRTPGEGEAMILEGNAFIERVLPGSIRRKLSDEEMAAYRSPFLTPDSRRPIWRLPNELPIEGKPADVHAVLEAAHAALPSPIIPSCCSLEIRARWSRRPLPNASPPRSRTAKSCRLDPVCTICRKITPRQSASRSLNGFPRSKPSEGRPENERPETARIQSSALSHRSIDATFAALRLAPPPAGDFARRSRPSSGSSRRSARGMQLRGERHAAVTWARP